MGLDLPRDIGTDRLTWRRLASFAEQLAGTEGSAFVRSVDPERVGWSLSAHLAACLVDEARIANWQRTKDGADGRRQPKPIPRPGDRERNAEKSQQVENAAQLWEARRAKRKRDRAARASRAASA